MPCYNYDGDKLQMTRYKDDVPSNSSQIPSEKPNTDLEDNYPQPREEDRVVFQPTQPPIQQQSSFNSAPVPSAEELNDYRSAQRLSMIALLAAGISYFIGGVPLSIVALIIAIIAFRKIKHYYESEETVLKAQWAQSMKLIQIALIFSGAGIILNAMSTVYLLNVLQSGGYENLFTGSSGQALSNGLSVWG